MEKVLVKDIEYLGVCYYYIYVIEVIFKLELGEVCVVILGNIIFGVSYINYMFLYIYNEVGWWGEFVCVNL